MSRTIVVVGGGIAGLSAAWQLARRGAARVSVLEQESLWFYHASGRNAAIYRPVEADPNLVALASRSLALFRALSPTQALVEPTGLILLHGREGSLEPARQTALEHGVACELLSPAQLAARLDHLELPTELYGLHAASAGVIDVHALAELLTSACRGLGVELCAGVAVSSVVTHGARVTGVRLASGETLRADDVVLAAGAWAGQLGASVDCSLALTPMRRHLALLEPTRLAPASLPALWRLDDEVYFRREGSRILASPCDETAWRVGAPQTDLEHLAPLATKLASIDARLGRARVVRTWACLRTFAPDRRPVIGSDARLFGLHWLTALGGFGMSTGLGAAELLADAVFDERQAPALSPERFRWAATPAARPSDAT